MNFEKVYKDMPSIYQYSCKDQARYCYEQGMENSPYRKILEGRKCGDLTTFLCKPQPFKEEFGHLIRPGHDSHEGAIEVIEAMYKKILEQRQILRSEALLNTSLHREREQLLLTKKALEREVQLRESWTHHHRRTVEIKLKQVREIQDSFDKTFKDLVEANKRRIELSGVADDFRKERDIWADGYYKLKELMMTEIEEIKDDIKSGNPELALKRCRDFLNKRDIDETIFKKHQKTTETTQADKSQT